MNIYKSMRRDVCCTLPNEKINLLAKPMVRIYTLTLFPVYISTIDRRAREQQSRVQESMRKIANGNQKGNRFRLRERAVISVRGSPTVDTTVDG